MKYKIFFKMKFTGGLTCSCFILFMATLFSIVSSGLYAQAGEILSEEEQKNKKIISALQNGVEILKYEIKRDKEIVAFQMKMPGLRKFRQTLKKDIIAKEKLIDELKSLLPSALSDEIKSLQKNLDEEKKIAKNANVTSSRIQRATRVFIKNSIPLKIKNVAFFEKKLSEF